MPAATVASIDVTLKLLGADAFQAGMTRSGSIAEQTGVRVTRAMEGISGATGRVVQASSGLARTDAALRDVGISALRTETSIAGLTRGMTLFNTTVAALGGGVAVGALRNYADTATNIANRLAAVVPVQAQRAAIDQEIFDTAQRTRTSYEATANLFSRLTLSAGQLGASQTDILKVVETTQKALQAGGATVSESASIATQLTQALGSGRLAGDELRSIAENSPVLIQAIAREFGVTVGALKDMGSAGELAADRVFKAILNAGAEVDEVFSRIKPTIAGGIQQIDNALVRYIGNLDKSLGATTALSRGLEFVAQNIAGIGDAAILAVTALAAPIAARVLGAGAGRVAAPFRAVGAEAAEGVEVARGSLASATQARQTAQVGLRSAEDALRTASAAGQARALEQVAQAKGALNRTHFAEQEALGAVAAAEVRATTSKVALAGTARAATGAVSGLVGVLGGPFGAALTAASVGLIGYELYQARATARVEAHTDALRRLADRQKAIRDQEQRGEVRSDREIVGDRALIDQAAKGVRDRRDALLGAYNRAATRDITQGDLGGGASAPSILQQAASNVGENLAQVVERLRTFPPASAEATAASEALVRVLTEAARIDPHGFTAIADGAADIQDRFKRAAAAVQEFEAARQKAIGEALDREFDLTLPDDTGEAIDKATRAGREVADAFSMGAADRIQTGTELTDALNAEAERAKTAFQAALGTIDTDTLKNALTAVGSSLDLVKGNLDGTKVASGEAAAASVALAKAMDLMTASRPDLSGAIAEVARYANALRTAIGLSATVAGATLNGEDKVAADARQREQSLKAYEDRLQRADKSPEARRVRIGRDLPGLTAAEIARLDAAENPEKAGRKPAKSKEERAADTLAKKLEELDQDAGVSALNSFDQKTVRFAQSAKVAADQIQAFITAAKSGDLSDVPPVMGQIYEKMKLLEGVKLARNTLDELFPARKLARELEELRAAANASPEIAQNLGLIEAKIREKNAPEWVTGFSSAFTDVVKSVANGSSTIGDALANLKRKIIDLALDAALKPIQTQITSLFSSLFAGGGGGGGISLANLGNVFSTGGFNPIPGFADGGMPSVSDDGIISGPGTDRSDSILARVSNREAIVNAAAVRHYGPAFIQAVNNRSLRLGNGFEPAPTGEFGEAGGYGEVLA